MLSKFETVREYIDIFLVNYPKVLRSIIYVIEEVVSNKNLWNYRKYV